MPLYMTQFAYTTQAWARLVKNPEDRSVVLSELVENLGGRMLALYYCRGEYDGIFLFEALDEATANAIVLAAISPGHVRTTRTTELFTVEETLEAMRKAGAVTYRGPTE